MKRIQTKTMVGIALFAALAYGVTFVFRLPVGFLTFDAKDAVIAIAAFFYGPVSAVAMAAIAALLELVTVSGTGLYGFLMNFVSSAVFSAAASLIYRYRRSLSGAILGLYAGTVAMTAVMLGMNLWITPIYTGANRSDVVAMIPTLLLPFNAAKALLNSALALLLYKPISTAMKRAGFLPKNPTRPGTSHEKAAPSDPQTAQNTVPPAPGFHRRDTLVAVLVGAITLAAAIVIFVILRRASS